MNNNGGEKVYPSEKQLTDCSKDTNKRARLGIATTKLFFSIITREHAMLRNQARS